MVWLSLKSSLFNMALKREAEKFCLNTTTHGFKFIALPKRTWQERVLWILVTVSCLLVAVALSWIAWTKIQKYPTTLRTDSPHYPIWNYPFPAVTVCNFNTISKKRAYETADKLKRPQSVTVDKLAKDFKLLYHLIDATFPEIPYTAFTNLQNLLDDNNVLIEELMQHLAPNCHEMLERCAWKGQQIPCSKLFVQTKTAEGHCCSFNYFALKNSSTLSVHAVKKPRRVAAAGFETALQAVVNIAPEDYFASPFSSFGHRVLIHYPYDFPSGNVLTMLQSIQGSIFIEVEPSLYRTDENVMSLPIAQRKCLFPNEMELINFEYTYFNCINQCRANLTERLCGCVPFYYYYQNNNGSQNPPSRVCNLRDIFCLFKNKQTIYNSIPGYIDDVERHINDHEWLFHTGNCTCLPGCTYCQYSIEGSAGEFSKQFALNKPNLFGGVELTNKSVFRVFFDDLASTRYTMSIRFYWHTILGSFGGVLGIFTGISTLSLIEITYFFTIGPIINLLVQKKNSIKQRKINVNAK